MIRNYYSQFFCIAFLVYAIVLSSCGNIIPPSGGARDTIPPILVNALPAERTTNFNAQKIVLTFNEYVQLANVQQQLIVAPNPTNPPQIDSKLKTITIRLKDSLLPNTTYSINFGNAIQDINENNPLLNFTYLFSTSSQLDSNTIGGRALLAETGLVDTTLIVVAHSNLSDTSVVKNRPTYYTTIDNKGNFLFKNLPNKAFNLFIVPNDYAKKYDDSTKLFGFMDSAVLAGNNPNGIEMLAFNEYKKTIVLPTNSSKPKEPVKFKYLPLTPGYQHNVLAPLTLFTNKPVKQFDASKIQLTDTLFKPITAASVIQDSNAAFTINYSWVPERYFKLIIQKDAFIDSSNNTLPKTDTISFATKNESEYGSLIIRFNKIDTANTTKLLLIQQDKIVQIITINKPMFKQSIFMPGEYDVRILYDKNNNGKWDAGSYKNRLQPEQVIAYPQKLSVKPRYDNEAEIKW